MRMIRGADEVFEKVLSKTDKIIFNLFYLIHEDEKAFIATDDATYIIGQSNEYTPFWMWLKEKPSDIIRNEICNILESRLTLKLNLKVNAYEKLATDILDSISQKLRINYRVSMPMTVYACDNVIYPINFSGQIVMPKEEHKEILKKFITNMAYDAEKEIINEEAANGFANWAVNTDKLYLWEDNGEIVSMASIAHKTKQYARINTVFTEHGHRGKGFAGMLLSQICQMVLQEDITPMLYADSRNPASNSSYKKIGFVKYGEVTQYLFGEGKNID